MKHQKYTLKNGLTVILAPQRDTKALTALTLVKVGSRYETWKNAGISHFIEHLFFKGTEKRPTTAHISKELDAIGAEYNAFTGKDRTGYYIKASATKAELLLDMLSDMYYNSVFKQEEIDRERGVIIEEISMYEDNPLMHIDNMIEGVTFGEKTTLGRDIAGTRDTMRGITRNQIISFYKKYYRTDNTYLVLAGKMNEKKIKDLINTYFGEERKPKTAKAKFTNWKKTQKKFQENMLKKQTEQTQLAMGFPAYSYFHKDAHALSVLSTILGGSMSSRLFTEVRERRGLAYFVSSYTDIFEDTGIFVVQAGLDSGRLKEATQTILQELQKIKNEPVAEEELKLAKDYIKGKLVLKLEDSENVANWLGRQQMFLGKTLSAEEQMEKVEKVTIKDIQRVAKNIFKADAANLAIIGNKHSNHYQKLFDTYLS